VSRDQYSLSTTITRREIRLIEGAQRLGRGPGVKLNASGAANPESSLMPGVVIPRGATVRRPWT